jgi:hypothetical protein
MIFHQTETWYLMALMMNIFALEIDPNKDYVFCIK